MAGLAPQIQACWAFLLLFQPCSEISRPRCSDSVALMQVCSNAPMAPAAFCSEISAAKQAMQRDFLPQSPGNLPIKKRPMLLKDLHSLPVLQYNGCATISV